MSKRIIIAGGGTGGHIFPAVAIANAIRVIDPACNILFVGAKGRMEMEKVPAAGYEIRGIDIAGFNRSALLKNISLPFKVVKSFAQVSRIISAFRPDAVVGVGGYAAFPVLRYAQWKGIPTFIHESNSFAGKTNILLGKRAKKIFVAGEGMEKFFPADKLMVTGNPVRRAIAEGQVSRAQAAEFFGIDATRKTVLVTGGSQGARSINEAVANGIEQFATNDLQLVWQTGGRFAEQAKELTKGKQHIWTNGFITRMEYGYAAADMVVSRAGAMAIAELCVMQKPAILVPLPTAAEDHQTVNAKKLVEKEAGEMITDAQAKTGLLPAIIALAADDQKRERLKNNIGKLAVANADERVAREIIRMIHG